MNTGNFNDKELSQLYATIRPSYPQYVVDQIISKCCENWGFKGTDEIGIPGLKKCCAIDVGCGTGIFTRLLAPYFGKVIGIDVSETQLEAAKKFHENGFRNICYKKLDVFHIKSLLNDGIVEAGDVCLITIAATLHWLDIPKVMQLLVEAFPWSAQHGFSDKVVVAPVTYVLPEIMHQEIRKSEFKLLNPDSLCEQYRSEQRCLNFHFKQCINILFPLEQKENIWLKSFFRDTNFEKFFKNFSFEGVSILKQSNLNRLKMFVESLGTYKGYVTKHKNELSDGQLQDPAEEAFSLMLEDFGLQNGEKLDSDSCRESLEKVEIQLRWNYFYYTLHN